MVCVCVVVCVFVWALLYKVFVCGCVISCVALCGLRLCVWGAVVCFMRVVRGLMCDIVWCNRVVCVCCFIIYYTIRYQNILQYDTL